MIRNLYINSVFFKYTIAILLAFIAGYLVESAFVLAQISVFMLAGISVLDFIVLFRSKKPVFGVRFISDKLSNGDQNEIRIHIENRYGFSIRCMVIDEIPIQFQKRNVKFHLTLQPGVSKIISYHVRPVKRGMYSFGAIHIFVSSPIGIIRRRIKFPLQKNVPVYPSYLQLFKYELMSISHRLSELGVKKIRKIGHNIEFEQIKEYVQGDDYRTINWKATARTSNLMVNTYQDERSQQVYCLIDKGRAMRLPFDGMTLLDYAINASLIISNIAIKKDDKAGIITFHHAVTSLLPASNRKQQISHIMETLYNQKTSFKESDFSRLFTTIRSKLSHRSLLLLFTNFETISGLERQLPYLRKLAIAHVLVVIFFENTSLKELIDQPTKKLRGIYHKAIAEKYMLEKRMVGKILGNHGIYSILTTPKDLSVDVINKYLELKSRGLI